MTSPGANVTSNVPITNGTASSGTGSTSSYYTSPFQNHIDQLEQEYDAQADMADDHDASDHSTGPGPYAQAFLQQAVHGLPQPLNQQTQASSQSVTTGPAFAVNHIFDPYDPILDADPFGLTASMHFPTPFSFETSSMR